jgi:hypothetical protein
VPLEAKNILTLRTGPIARKLGILDRLVTFPSDAAVLGMHPQNHGTLRDTPGCVSSRHHYDDWQRIRGGGRESVMRAVNSHATAVLDSWKPAVEGFGLRG